MQSASFARWRGILANGTRGRPRTHRGSIFRSGSDFYLRGAEGFNFPARALDLIELRDEPMMREMFARRPVEIAVEYISVYLELIERAKTLPHALSLADCPVSNFFHLPGETIAIDWAGLGSEPVGADGGRFIGSALTWGRRFVEIARSERELFEAYLDGLREGGATEGRNVLRSGYLSELGFYLVLDGDPALDPCSTETRPVGRVLREAATTCPSRNSVQRLQAIVDLIPSYIDELRALLA